MRIQEAKRLCPQLLTIPSRPKRYAELSQKIMTVLQSFTSVVEIFSVDEAFLDITHSKRLMGLPEKIGRLVKQKVMEVSGLLCSVGVSGDKTTAKFAAKFTKPNGFTVIPPWEVNARLKNVPVNELCGIGEGITHFLANYGVVYCGDMEKLPISILAKRFGNIGRRIWLMCQGADPDPVHTVIADPKSMGHGKVMPPNTHDKNTLLTYLYHMCVKLAARLRCYQMFTQHLFIGWKTYREGWIGGKVALAYPSHDSKEFYELGKQMLNTVWKGQAAYQVQVTALDPMVNVQHDLFEPNHEKREKLNQSLMKLINYMVNLLLHLLLC